MSKTAEFYRTPSQDEVEYEERLEYLEWYQKQNNNNNNQNKNQNGDKSTLSNK